VLDSKEYPFEIKDNNKTIVKKIVNKRIKGTIEIVKVDDSKNLLAGVTFEILDSNKKVIAKITTNEKGIASLSNLELGDYYYKEIAAPAGYIIDSKIHKFEIKNRDKIVKEVVNFKIYGTLEIIKIDDVNKKPLQGVKFEILDQNKNVVDTLVTDINGKAASKKLAYGKYTYREVEVPNDIVIDNAQYPFEITKANQIITKTIINTKIKGSLEILKLDEKTKEPIAGVKFQILDENKNVIETLTTNKEGKAESSKLLKGTYFYKEIEAPSKYIVDNKEYKFKIEVNEIVVQKVVFNKEKELPITGGLGTDNVITLLVTLLSVTGFIAFKKKKIINK
ncbi:MAG: SpaA isopeptide-forming pilin-related protein, partial [Clostridia bacterium]